MSTETLALIVEILARKGRPMTAIEIVEASDGVLRLGWIFSRLNALERQGAIESTYTVRTVKGLRIPERMVRLLPPRPDLSAIPQPA